MSNSMDELKPCPFCGSDVHMVYYRKQVTEFMQNGFISCDGCYAVNGQQWSDIRTDTRHETFNEERKIKAWNTRHDD